MALKLFVYVASSLRILLGLAPFLFPKKCMSIFKFPQEHDNESARMMARLFGVRDIGLGLLTVAVLLFPQSMIYIFLFNIAIDSGDVFSFLFSMGKNNPCRKAAINGALVASFAVAAWSFAVIFLMERM